MIHSSARPAFILGTVVFVVSVAGLLLGYILGEVASEVTEIHGLITSVSALFAFAGAFRILSAVSHSTEVRPDEGLVVIETRSLIRRKRRKLSFDEITGVEFDSTKLVAKYQHRWQLVLLTRNGARVAIDGGRKKAEARPEIAKALQEILPGGDIEDSSSPVW